MPYLGNPAQQRFSSPRAASVYSGDGSTVAFTLEEVVTTDEDILVSVDGVIQEPSVAYAVSSGTTLTFTAAPSTNSGNNIFVYYIARTFGSISMPDGQNVTAANGTFSGTLGVTGASTLTGAVTAASSLAMTSNDPTITMTDSSGTNDIVTLQSTSGALIVTARDGNANGEIIFKGDTGSAVTEHMRINNAGIITKPLQPAFCVHPASQVNNLAINTVHNPIAFGTERFDNNSDFASNTFTAPVTGKYQLQFTLYLLNVDVDTAYIETKILTSNESYLNLLYSASGDTDMAYQTIHNSVVADMDANDTAVITLQIPNNGAAQMDIATDSFFSGALLC